MQTKKIIGIALVAAMLTSAASISASAVLTADDAASVGVIGSFNGWTEDYAKMSDDDGDGIWEADIIIDEVTTDMIAELYSDNVATGKMGINFKVRLNNDWADSWGDYEEDYDRTYNSQTNMLIPEADVTVGEPLEVLVKFDTTGENNKLWPVTYEIVEESAANYGVIGSFNGWSEDIAKMSDNDGDGIWEAVIEIDEVTSDMIAELYSDNVATGKMGINFKVRKDDDWAESWGDYEEDYDRTFNSQTNMLIPEADVTVGQPLKVKVTLDTTGADFHLWPVTYTIVKDEESKPEESKPEESKPEESKTEESKPEESKPEEPKYYETKVEDYIFYDNTYTKWDKVYAYWYGTTEGTIGYNDNFDVLGRNVFVQDKFPGMAMEKVEGTEYWRVLRPFGADHIIFNNGYSDDEVKADFRANKATKAFTITQYQTTEILYDDKTDGGKVYAVAEGTTTEHPDGGGGANALKNKYVVAATEGAAVYTTATYTGPFTSEKFGEEEIKGNEVDGKKDGDGKQQVSTDGNGGNGNGNGGNGNGGSGDSVPATGDAGMAVGFAAISITALGAAVLASKKKEEQE